jgi:hypothetical protein
MIRTYTKKELALCYFPNSKPRTAVNHLMSWIGRCHQLSDHLKASGYQPSRKDFTPHQVRLIVEYLGEP